MKKLFFALLIALATFSFTSCEPINEPSLKPIYETVRDTSSYYYYIVVDACDNVKPSEANYTKISIRFDMDSTGKIKPYGYYKDYSYIVSEKWHLGPVQTINTYFINYFGPKFIDTDSIHYTVNYGIYRFDGIEPRPYSDDPNFYVDGFLNDFNNIYVYSDAYRGYHAYPIHKRYIINTEQKIVGYQ